MIIVADSGSTKTDWRIYDKQHGVKEIQTIGLNPYFVTSQDILNVLTKEVDPFINRMHVLDVFFYGAGCTHSDKITEIESALSDYFTSANIYVESDMLGTARALCSHSPGIVAILGTGSNSCVFDGKEIKEQLLSLGYVLGDEGSGAVLGRKILKGYFSGKMPKHLGSEFKVLYQLEPDLVLEQIYRKPFPSRYLASFVHFAIENMNDLWFRELLQIHLQEFFNEIIFVYEDYKKYQLHFSGSLAWHLKPIIEEMCSGYGIKPGKFVQQPIDDLLRFHLQQYQV